jgi:hypothetical protein
MSPVRVELQARPVGDDTLGGKTDSETDYPESSLAGF